MSERRFQITWQALIPCCSMLQRVAACCSVLQCVICTPFWPPWIRALDFSRTYNERDKRVCCNTLQHTAAHCNLCGRLDFRRTVSNYLPRTGSVLQCVAVCCSVLQCVAVCCSVLQCVAVCYMNTFLNALNKGARFQEDGFKLVAKHWRPALNDVRPEKWNPWLRRIFTYRLSHVWMSHVTRMNESCHTYERVMSYVWMSRATHMNESCRTYEWFMSHIWMTHVTHECFMPHTWMIQVTHMNESCRTYEWVMPHVWMSQAARMNESCRTYEWVMPHVWMSHAARMNESCCTYEEDSYVDAYLHLCGFICRFTSSYLKKNECIFRHSIFRHESCHSFPPKMREIALWPSTNEAIVHLLVLPGSLLSITEITEYTHFSPSKPSCELKYKSE